MFFVNVIKSENHLVNYAFKLLGLEKSLLIKFKFKLGLGWEMANNPLPTYRFISTCRSKMPCIL